MKKRILYHITARKNIKSIMKYGLIPKKPSYGFPEKHDYKFVKGVYLTTKKSNYKDEYTVTLKVKIHGLKLIKDKDENLKDSYYVENIIEPSRISIPK